MIKLIKKYKNIIIIILLLIILFISIYYFYKKINEQFYNIILNQWGQLGQSINGEMPNDKIGRRTLSLSSDGQIVAISSHSNNDYTGNVRLFKLDTTQTPSVWVQFGQTINGEMIDDQSGYSVSLSSDGQIVAIGSPNNNDYTGHVRIFKLDTTQNPPVWEQFGQSINGEMSYDYSGYSVALSSDGQIVAIGSPDNNSYTGHVRLFKIDTTQTLPVWVQFGQTIIGEMIDDESGYSVSLSSDGQIVAIGSPDNNDNTGHVRLFKIDTTQSPPVWVQFGQTIIGEMIDDDSGSKLSLSSDGQIVAISSPYNNNSNGDSSGHVRIFKYNSEEPTTTMPITTTTMPSTTTTMPSTTSTMSSTTTTMPITTSTMPSTTSTMPSTTTTMPITTSTMGIMPSSTTTMGIMGIMPTMQEPLNYNYDDYNIGMMLKGSNNTGNLNDFLAKNTLLGNNLYISPMNQTGIVGDDYDSNIVKNNKNIDSTFTPMIKLG